jgi:hypothetical protein
MKPLPPEFTMCCPEVRWLVVAPSVHSLGRTFDRQEMCAVDSGTLSVTSDDAPLVPQRALLSSATA